MGDFPFTNRQRRWWFAQLDDSSSSYDRVMAEQRDKDMESRLTSTSFYRGTYFGKREEMQAVADHFGGQLEEFKRSGFTYWAVRVNGVLIGPDDTRKPGSVKRFK